MKRKNCGHHPQEGNPSRRITARINRRPRHNRRGGLRLIALTFVPLSHPSQRQSQSKACDNPIGVLCSLLSDCTLVHLMNTPPLSYPRFVQQVGLQTTGQRRQLSWQSDSVVTSRVPSKPLPPGLLRGVAEMCWSVPYRWRTPVIPQLILINGPLSAPE